MGAALQTRSVSLPSPPVVIAAHADAPAPRWRLRLLAALMILLVTGLRLAYLLADCPLDLSPDEAHYWHWSRNLDWSYYSKGPAVAYLVRGSCTVFGDTMPAVRLPAVLLGALTLWGLYVLTCRVYEDDRHALALTAIAVTLPVFHAGALLMTIDAPYVCAWTWALVVAHGILKHSSACEVRWQWLLLGLLVGVGILAKYTMVLFVPSLGLYLLASPLHRVCLRKAGFWWMTAVAAVCCVPMVIWNARHDWVTFAHVGRQAGVSGEPAWRPLGPLEYLGGQAGLLLGVWFAVWVLAVLFPVRIEPAARASGLGYSGGISPSDRRFLWWLSVPMFAAFLAFSWKTNIELNWPITAYLSGMVLAVGMVGTLWSSRWWRGAMVSAAGLGMAGTVGLLYSEEFYPTIARTVGDADSRVNPRQFDPTCRLRGWRTLAAEVDRLRRELAEERPLLAASTWSYPGNLSFYCAGRPEVYSFARAAGGRHSQYDFWRPNPIRDPHEFHGRHFIYVGDVTDSIREAFDSVEPSREVVHSAHGLRVAAWQVTVCRGFRGFAQLGPDRY